jgi:nucleoside-diphosphate-sugar epimerase
MSRRIFITGASGNTGQALLDIMCNDPELHDASVTCLVRPGGRRENLERYPVHIVEGDASRADSLGHAYGGEPIVIHISSIFHTKAVLEACRVLDRLVVISSTGVFSRYRSIAERIAAGERETERSGTRYTILRPTMIYGVPADRNISRLIRLVQRSPIIPLPAGGSSVFQPVHVEDLASCILAALKREESVGKTYNVPGGSAHTLKEIVTVIAGILGKRITTVTVPFALADLAVRMYERLARNPRLRREQILRLREDKSFEYTEAAGDLGYAPMTFREGVARQIVVMGLRSV